MLMKLSLEKTYAPLYIDSARCVGNAITFFDCWSLLVFVLLFGSLGELKTLLDSAVFL